MLTGMAGENVKRCEKRLDAYGDRWYDGGMTWKTVDGGMTWKTVGDVTRSGPYIINRVTDGYWEARYVRNVTETVYSWGTFKLAERACEIHAWDAAKLGGDVK